MWRFSVAEMRDTCNLVRGRGYGEFDKIEINGNEITAGVGAKLREIAYAARGANLGGLEWMEGIPAVVGGALRMNAGAMGGQTFDHVTSVRYLDREGNAHAKKRAELEVHYREFPLLKENFAISATFSDMPAKREQEGSVAIELEHAPATRRVRVAHRRALSLDDHVVGERHEIRDGGRLAVETTGRPTSVHEAE